MKGEQFVALRLQALFLTLLVFVAAQVSAQTTQSAYTSLDPKQCTKVKSAEAGDYEGRCRGIGGYSLLVVEGDLRQNITVITPQGAKHSLEL